MIILYEWNHVKAIWKRTERDTEIVFEEILINSSILQFSGQIRDQIICASYLEVSFPYLIVDQPLRVNPSTAG